jgi:hypothetical protein
MFYGDNFHVYKYFWHVFVLGGRVRFGLVLGGTIKCWALPPAAAGTPVRTLINYALWSARRLSQWIGLRTI